VTPTNDAEDVAVLLGLAGLSVGDDDLAYLVVALESHRRAVERLWSIPDARYEVPALHFDASPPLVEWGVIDEGG